MLRPDAPSVAASAKFHFASLTQPAGSSAAARATLLTPRLPLSFADFFGGRTPPTAPGRLAGAGPFFWLYEEALTEESPGGLLGHQTKAVALARKITKALLLRKLDLRKKRIGGSSCDYRGFEGVLAI